MREIKFRAWDKILRIMYYDFRMSSKGKVILPDTDFGDDDILENLILLQFTGLRDKNGKEIFEGDIIIETKVGEEIWGEYQDNGGIVEKTPSGEVVYTHHRFDVKQLSKGLVKLKKGGYSELNLDDYDGEFIGWDDCEVIGNIYENPELLENKK